MAAITSPNGDPSHPASLHNQANQRGYMVAYPNGTRGPRAGREARSWNSGNLTSPTNFAERQNIDDISYLREVLQDITATHPIDPRRIFITGISNGGQMAYRAAHAMPGEIAAIAPVAGGDEIFRNFGEQPPSGVALLHIHGTLDPAVPFAQSGVSPLFPSNEYAGGRPSIGGWIRAHGAVQQGGPEVVDATPFDGMKTVFRKFASRLGDIWTAVIWGAGHTWPDGQQYLPPAIVGRTGRDFSGNQRILDFFDQHPKR
jgi:polyhydroxybutyrate depolymerase